MLHEARSIGSCAIGSRSAVWCSKVQGKVDVATTNQTAGASGSRTGPDEVIRCEKLTKRYKDGNILAVDQLDLAVYRGEILGLFGPNGAGRTTTVGMLTTAPHMPLLVICPVLAGLCIIFLRLGIQGFRHRVLS